MCSQLTHRENHRGHFPYYVHFVSHIEAVQSDCVSLAQCLEQYFGEQGDHTESGLGQNRMMRP